MKYVDYRNTNDFYTIAENCAELGLSKKELQYYSEKYKIPPEQNQDGIYGFRKVQFCKLHNYIYKEQKSSEFSSAPQVQRKDPWA